MRQDNLPLSVAIEAGMQARRQADLFKAMFMIILRRHGDQTISMDEFNQVSQQLAAKEIEFDIEKNQENKTVTIKEKK